MEEQRRITPWRVLKWTLLLISLLVYAIVFVRLFTACDAKISDDIILTSEEKILFDDLERDYPLYNYQPASWTNEEGTLQVKNIYYIEPASKLQLTVRYRIDAFESEPFIYRVRTVDDDSEVKAEEGKKLYMEDLPGQICDVTSYTETRFNYSYTRLCVENIVVDEGVKTTERVQTVDEEGNVTYGTKTVTEGGNKVYLDVYDRETEELFYSFVIAGKTVSGVRTRRNKVDTVVID